MPAKPPRHSRLQENMRCGFGISQTVLCFLHWPLGNQHWNSMEGEQLYVLKADCNLGFTYMEHSR